METTFETYIAGINIRQRTSEKHEDVEIILNGHYPEVLAALLGALPSTDNERVDEVLLAARNMALRKGAECCIRISVATY